MEIKTEKRALNKCLCRQCNCRAETESNICCWCTEGTHNPVIDKLKFESKIQRVCDNCDEFFEPTGDETECCESESWDDGSWGEDDYDDDSDED